LAIFSKIIEKLKELTLELKKFQKFSQKICRKSDECFEKKISALIFSHQCFFGLRQNAKSKKLK
jgi:hypothetical protein